MALNETNPQHKTSKQINNMSDTMQLTSPSMASIVPIDGGNIEVSAQTPIEMVQCHEAMIRWCENKISLVKNEARELKEAFEHAVKRKWKSATLKRHTALAEKRVTFYEKILEAFKAGYYIVPNFPVTLFAIRTKAQSPKSEYCLLKWSGQHNFQQEAQVLAQGEGEYQNPNPIIRTGPAQEIQESGGTVTKQPFWADKWDDMEFPANMARLHVMEAATRAMALKVFDEVGFLPEDHKRNPDPVLVGRIIDPRPQYYGPKRRISFMIGWHIDTRTL